MSPRDHSRRETGFTLIEVLMALIVFAMIATLAYAALGTAGNGFEMLSKVRLAQERSSWVGRQLRLDLRYLSPPPAAYGQQSATVQDRPTPIRIRNDNRGDIDLDELWLLVREPGSPGITRLHYFIDERNSHLIRESISLLARRQVEPVRWDFGKVRSWSIEIWDREGNRRQDWNFPAANFVWPKAVRVTMKPDTDNPSNREQSWLMPVLVGSTL